MLVLYYSVLFYYVFLILRTVGIYLFVSFVVSLALVFWFSILKRIRDFRQIHHIFFKYPNSKLGRGSSRSLNRASYNVLEYSDSKIERWPRQQPFC